jgi:ribonuclease P/MRP protein subunit RPP40
MFEIYQPLFNVVVSWTSEDGASTAIDFPPQFGVRQVPNGVRSLSRANDTIPALSASLFTDFGSSDAEEHAMSVIDWIGGLNIGLNKFVSDNETSESRGGIGTPFSVRFEKTENVAYSIATHTGVIASSRILCEFKKFLALVNEGELPWCCFSVWGFEDAPISWKNLEHSYYETGENDYVFFLLPESKIFLYKVTGLHDRSI